MSQTQPQQWVDDTPPHLTKRRLGHGEFDPSKLNSREWYCHDCQARVTESSDRTVEYGHQPACDHSIRQRDSHPIGGGAE